MCAQEYDIAAQIQLEGPFLSGDGNAKELVLLSVISSSSMARFRGPAKTNTK